MVGLQPAFVGGVGPMERHSCCMVSDLEFQGKFGRHGDKLVCWGKQVPDASFGWKMEYEAAGCGGRFLSLTR